MSLVLCCKVNNNPTKAKKSGVKTSPLPIIFDLNQKKTSQQKPLKEIFIIFAEK